MRVRNKFCFPLDRLAVATINQLELSVCNFSTWHWQSRSKSKLQSIKKCTHNISSFFCKLRTATTTAAAVESPYFFWMNDFATRHWLRHTRLRSPVAHWTAINNLIKNCAIWHWCFSFAFCVSKYYWLRELGLESGSVGIHVVVVGLLSNKLLLLALIYRMHSLSSDLLYLAVRRRFFVANQFSCNWDRIE